MFQEVTSPSPDHITIGMIMVNLNLVGFLPLLANTFPILVQPIHLFSEQCSPISSLHVLLPPELPRAGGPALGGLRVEGVRDPGRPVGP